MVLVLVGDSIVPSPSLGQCYLATGTTSRLPAPETLPLESCHAETRHRQHHHTHNHTGCSIVTVCQLQGVLRWFISISSLNCLWFAKFYLFSGHPVTGITVGGQIFRSQLIHEARVFVYYITLAGPCTDISWYSQGDRERPNLVAVGNYLWLCWTQSKLAMN